MLTDYGPGETRAKSDIRLIRRITGYLSTVDRFNDAKQEELKNRVVHF
ncbi:anaerobic ribonucleoside-triphosphate reductase [Desulfotomaculum nigrificans]